MRIIVKHYVRKIENFYNFIYVVHINFMRVKILACTKKYDWLLNDFSNNGSWIFIVIGKYNDSLNIILDNIYSIIEKKFVKY